MRSVTLMIGGGIFMAEVLRIGGPGTGVSLRNTRVLCAYAPQAAIKGLKEQHAAATGEMKKLFAGRRDCWIWSPAHQCRPGRYSTRTSRRLRSQPQRHRLEPCRSDRGARRVQAVLFKYKLHAHDDLFEKPFSYTGSTTNAIAPRARFLIRRYPEPW